jgi:hypothetical protein
MKCASGSCHSIMCSIKQGSLIMTSLISFSNRLGTKDFTTNVKHYHLPHSLLNKKSYQESPLKLQHPSLREIQIPTPLAPTISQSLSSKKQFLSTERRENRTTSTEATSSIATRTRMKTSWMIVRASRRSQGSPRTPPWGADRSLIVKGGSTEHNPWLEVWWPSLRRALLKRSRQSQASVECPWGRVRA